MAWHDGDGFGEEEDEYGDEEIGTAALQLQKGKRVRKLKTIRRSLAVSPSRTKKSVHLPPTPPIAPTATVTQLGRVYTNTKNKHVVENLMVYMQKEGVRSIIDLTYGEGNFWTDGLLKEYDVRMYDKYKHGGRVASYEKLALDAVDPGVMADLVVLDPPYRATGGGYNWLNSRCNYAQVVQSSFGAEHHLHRDNVLQFYESGLVNATCFNPKFLLVKVQDQADCVDNNAWWRQWGFDSPNCLMTLIQAGVELTALPDSTTDSSQQSKDPVSKTKEFLKKMMEKEMAKYWMEINSVDKAVLKNYKKFWSDRKNIFPYMSKVAQKWLGVVATSAPSERLFSVLGNTVTKKRNRLSPELVNAIAFNWSYDQRENI
eukprot:g14366.t1